MYQAEIEGAVPRDGRKRYRSGKKERAVKVYTVNQESKYLLVTNVPALGTTTELLQLFALHGTIDEYQILDDYPTADQFTDVYWIRFADINAARHAKRRLDDYNFFANRIRVEYAPEFETVDETREKIVERRRAVAKRLNPLWLKGGDPDKQKQESLPPPPPPPPAPLPFLPFGAPQLPVRSASTFNLLQPYVSPPSVHTRPSSVAASSSSVLPLNAFKAAQEAQQKTSSFFSSPTFASPSMNATSFAVQQMLNRSDPNASLWEVHQPFADESDDEHQPEDASVQHPIALEKSDSEKVQEASPSSILELPQPSSHQPETLGKEKESKSAAPVTVSQAASHLPKRKRI